MLSLGILCHFSLWSNKRYLNVQWKIMDENYETISECSSCTLTTISVKETKYF